MSSNRLFRVRAKQQFCSEISQVKHHCAALFAQLLVLETCAFSKHTESGGVLEGYCNLQGLKRRPTSAQPYKGSSSEVCRKGIGVLCAWFS